MIRKVIAIILLAGIATGTGASARSLYDINDAGITHGYNGSFWYDQTWIDFIPDSTHHFTVKAYVKKNGTRYGQRNTHVAPGVRTTCYSDQVQGSGGLQDCDVVVWV